MNPNKAVTGNHIDYEFSDAALDAVARNADLDVARRIHKNLALIDDCLDNYFGVRKEESERDQNSRSKSFY